MGWYTCVKLLNVAAKRGVTFDKEDERLKRVLRLVTVALQQGSMTSRARLGRVADDVTSCRASLTKLGLEDTPAFAAAKAQLQDEDQQGLAEDDEDMLATAHSAGGIGG